MGYLDNKSITVDAILTKKGRELLSRNDGSFNITSFALADDEIDYSLYNENHPNGSQFAGEAIENLPLLEAFPDESNIMRHKLITLNRNITTLPLISITNQAPNLNKGDQGSISPQTLNYDASVNSIEPNGYIFTVKDRRLFTSFIGEGQGTAQQASITPVYGNVAVSETVIGNSLSFTAISTDSLFGTNSKLITTITIEGRDTGARATIPVTINKEASGATQFAQGQTATETY